MGRRRVGRQRPSVSTPDSLSTPEKVEVDIKEDEELCLSLSMGFPSFGESTTNTNSSSSNNATGVASTPKNNEDRPNEADSKGKELSTPPGPGKVSEGIANK